MTDEEFDNLTREQMERLSDEVIEAKSHAVLARALLSYDVLPKFSRHVTDSELLSPPFYDEARRRFNGIKLVLGAVVENEDLRGRFHRVGEAKVRWNEVREIAGVAESLMLYLRLVSASEWYEGLCRTKRLLTDDDAGQSAVALRAQLRRQGTDWRQLTDELGRFIETRQNPPDEAWALLPRQHRTTAFRTFVIRLIADELKECCPTPRIRLIADLATATLPEGKDIVTEQHVRTALRLDDGNLRFGRKSRRKTKD